MLLVEDRLRYLLKRISNNGRQISLSAGSNDITIFFSGVAVRQLPETNFHARWSVSTSQFRSPNAVEAKTAQRFDKC